MRKICIHVWRLICTGAEDVAALALLSPEEKARSRTFRFGVDAAAYVQTRAALRRLLAWYTETPPEALTFSYAVNGKPALTGTRAKLQFNVSHADGQALIAVCNGVEVGVDLESRQRNVNALALAEAWFHETEIEAVRTAAPPERTSTFLRCWTRKEAILKALGSGLTEALDTFAVPTDRWVESRTVGLSVARHSTVTLSSVNFDDDYIGAVAVSGPAALSLKLLEYRPDMKCCHLLPPPADDAAA